MIRGQQNEAFPRESGAWRDFSVKLLKRTVAELLAVSLLVTLTVTSAHAEGYTDTAGHWAEERIDRWSARGYLNGYGDGTFGPDDPVSRGQLSAILCNLMGYTAEAPNAYGLPEDAWYTHHVLKAAAAGILPPGWEQTSSEEGMTREEAIYSIAAAARMSPVGMDLAGRYTDGALVSDWAAGAVGAMTERGIVAGFETGELRPQGTLTRAETVTMLDNTYAEVYNYPGVFSGEVNGTAIVNMENVTLQNLTVHGDLILTQAVRDKVVTLDHVTVEGEIANLGRARVVVYNDTYPDGTVSHKDRTAPVPAGARANVLDPARYYYDDNGYYTYRSSYLDTEVGIDVSSHQSEIDWDAVAASGVDFAILRLGYRGYTEGSVNLDSRFLYNLEEARRVGLDVGVYFFSQAITPEEAVEEAEFVLSVLNGTPLQYPVIFDWESISSSEARTDNLDNAVLSQCVQAFCDRIALSGYQPGVYFNKTWGYFRHDQAQLASYYTWFAGYTEAPDCYYAFDMWQYSSSGSVPGIEGKVDLDMAFRRP